MPELSVRVTRDVLAQLAAGNNFQSQIALAGPTGHLVGLVASANGTNRVDIPVGGFLVLRLGDTGAFWRAHQSTAVAYDRLFALLEPYPDQWLRFTW